MSICAAGIQAFDYLMLDLMQNRLLISLTLALTDNDPAYK